MAGGWLESGYDVNAIPPVNGPLVWYKFEQDANAPATASDSSGNGYDATVSDSIGA